MKRVIRTAPATVIACIALAVALSGTSYAAFVLPANSVGTKQLKNRSIQRLDIGRKTIASLRGQRGPQGVGFANSSAALGGASGSLGSRLLPSVEEGLLALDIRLSRGAESVRAGVVAGAAASLEGVGDPAPASRGSRFFGVSRLGRG
jgi:hypothetical protein